MTQFDDAEQAVLIAMLDRPRATARWLIRLRATAQLDSEDPDWPVSHQHIENACAVERALNQLESRGVIVLLRHDPHTTTLTYSLTFEGWIAASTLSMQEEVDTWTEI